MRIARDADYAADAVAGPGTVIFAHGDDLGFAPNPVAALCGLVGAWTVLRLTDARRQGVAVARLREARRIARDHVDLDLTRCPRAVWAAAIGLVGLWLDADAATRDGPLGGAVESALAAMMAYLAGSERESAFLAKPRARHETADERA